MDKILVTPRSITKEGGHPSLEKLKNAGYEVVFCKPGVQPSENELFGLLPGCIAYLAGVEKITLKVLESATSLKVISRNGVGIDNIDLEAAKRLNIKICKAEGANSRGVAELTISLILNSVRAINENNTLLKSNTWQRIKGVEVKGKTLGIIGCGRIGKEVALLALGLGMKVIGYDAFSRDFFTSSDSFIYTTFDEVLKKSDIISFHCPPKSDGTPLISSNEINMMKNNVYLINTARAELFDNDAVSNALVSNKIAGLAVDVFTEEPPVMIPLYSHPKVILTPHIGGFTDESVDRAMDVAVDNILYSLATVNSI
jgi:D-3-phosphoglycerate dehydrogenase / 2-oxoglutarate reductase